MQHVPVRVRTRQVGSITTTRVRKRNGVVQEEVSHTDTVPVPEDLKNPSYVSVKAGLTKNMGDYNSLSIGVTISMPCRAVESEIEKTYDQVSAIVERLLDSEYAKAINKAEGITDQDVPPIAL